ncbi:MAG: ATP synthase subunit I [Methylophilaceae bacterium]
MNDKETGLVIESTFGEMLRSQVLATAAVAVIAFAVSGMNAGLSAIAGGLSVALAAFIASKVAISKRKDAASILGSMLKAELIKILLIVLFLYITITAFKALVPWALIVGLAAAAIISGAAMSKRNEHLKI